MADLAETLRLAGEPREAVDACEQARGRYLRKGNLAGVRRVDVCVGRLHVGGARQDNWEPPPAAAISEV